MRTIHFDTDLTSNKTLMFYHQSGGGESIGGGKRKIFVKVDKLNPEEQHYTTEFLNLFNASATNFGVTLFNEELKGYFYTQPTIGLHNDGQLGLMIGASNNSEEKSDFIPLTFKKTSSDEEEDIAGDYVFQVTTKEGKLRVIKCNLIHRTSFYNPNEQRSYIVVKTSNFMYHIPFKASSDITAELAEEAWATGRFELVCSPFYKSNSSLSYLFRDNFRGGTFPDKGVILLLSNGQRNENQYNPNKPNSVWKLEASSHPELLVLSKSQKLENLVQLREIGKLYVPDSCDASKHVLSYPLDNKAFILHITSPHNSGNLDWMPSHTGVSGSLIQYVSAKFKTSYPEFFENVVQKFIETANKNLASSKTNVTTLKDDLESFDYPASKMQVANIMAEPSDVDSNDIPF